MGGEKKYYTFKKLVDTPYKVEHVYPIKQRDIFFILQNIPVEVERLYIFGSSINLNCGQESDIDLLVVGNKSDAMYQAFSAIFKKIDNEVDLIIKTQEEFEENLKDKGSICNVVQKEGLLIYERTL